MQKENIIVSERKRPFLQILIASIIFTLALAIVMISLWNFEWTSYGERLLLSEFKIVVFLLAIGMGLSSRKRVYIDLINHNIKPSVNIGPLKFGKWQKMSNLEYISIFLRSKKNGSTVYEVSLWYDRSKHIELYERNSFLDAYMIAFETSEYLNLDLLDSTEAQNARWVNKAISKVEGKIIYY